MQISDIITPGRVAARVSVASKKRALETLSEIFAEHSPSGLGAHAIFDSLLARERLGTTAIDHGVAIPHGRIKNSNETFGAFLQLDNGVDCDAFDGQAVDLMFALLVPEDSTEEHLQLLARLAQMFADDELRENLRNAESSRALYDLLIAWDQNH
jgi:PTS system nitrogen regulatory IIA component